MSNRLSMATIHSVETLHRSGHSNREIARLLDLDRGTVNKYVKRLQAAVRRDAGDPTGDHPSADDGQNRPNPQTGSAAETGPPGNGDFRDLTEPASGPESLCEAHRESIEQKLDAGLSMQRILQDLKTDHGFTGSDHSVHRFVLRLGKTTPLPFRRMETEPGEEAQIDFGTGAWVVGDDGNAVGRGCFESCCRIRGRRTARWSGVRRATTSSRRSRTRFIILAACRSGW